MRLNKTSQHPKSKQRMLVTADVSNVLQALNNNASWKNQSNKMTLTKTIKSNGKTIGANNEMTEAEIDQLFDRKPRSNIKTQTSTNLWGRPQHKDFMISIKFLRMTDCEDRLLTGLPPPSSIEFEEFKIEQRLMKEDLTQKFKQSYLVGKIIGQGAYASVRVAIYKPLNKKVAIKVYEKNKIKEPQRKKSVRRQIRLLQMLKHPNIVQIYDVVETNNHLNLVMEYLDGISLNNYIKNQAGHKITQKNCRKIIKGLAQALKYLHKKKISHRDIKLENVILDEGLSPKLIDFGFSTCIQDGKKVKIFCGTPSYMAPEIVQKKEYEGQPADIWALGVLFFVLITGIFPFKGSTDQELYSKINRADYPKSEIAFSKEISQLIGKMLRVSSDDRATATEILNHPWIKNANQTSNSSIKKKHKRPDSSSNQCKKRLTTTQSHKSKESWANKQLKRLTETYKQNLKLELRLAKQSPIRTSNPQTCTNRKFQKQANGTTIVKIQDKNLRLKSDKKKNQSKILDLLRKQMRMKEEKSKSKQRRV